MLKIFSPFDRKQISELNLQNSEEVLKTLEIADNLFYDRKKRLPAYKRIEILEKTAQIMSGKIEELTITATKEGGKPYKDSKVEILRAINGIKSAAAYIAHQKGEQIPMGLTEAAQNRFAFSVREPIGVVVAISAFNHPLNLIVHQAVTAIAVGCPVIVKPALTTPLSAIELQKIMIEARLPADWFQIVICDNENAELLATDKRVKYLSFIGSSKVGWYLRSKLAAGTRCALEHGGIAPVIVEKDAEISEIIAPLVKGAFYHAGQVCVSVQRIFVHKDLCASFTKEFIKQTEKLITGDPLDPKTDVGPFILPHESERVETWIQEAVNEGAEILIGGERISETCLKPTVLLNPSLNSKVSQFEIFGPVVCIYSFENRDTAVQTANNSDMHFQAAVFTKNIDIAMEISSKLNAKAVMINDHTAFRVDWMPFGGKDSSGLGVGGIKYSMDDMTYEKLTVIKSTGIF